MGPQEHEHWLKTVCQVPKTALLSHRTSSLANLLPREEWLDQTPHSVLSLALCVLHEFRLGNESPFWVYLQCLPRDTIPLPAFWSIEDVGGEDGQLALDMLRGTEAERDMRRKDKIGLSLVSMYLIVGLTQSTHCRPT